MGIARSNGRVIAVVVLMASFLGLAGEGVGAPLVPIRSLPIPVLPDPDTNLNGLALAGGTLYAINTFHDPVTNSSRARIYGLDPADGDVVGSFDAPFGGGLASDGTSLYVNVFIPVEGSIVKLDRTNGSVISTISPSGYTITGGAGGLAWLNGDLFQVVATTDCNGVSVVRLDGGSGSFLGCFNVDALGISPRELDAKGADLLYGTATSGGFTVYTLSPTTGAVLGAVVLSSVSADVNGLAYGGGELFVADRGSNAIQVFTFPGTLPASYTHEETFTGPSAPPGARLGNAVTTVSGHVVVGHPGQGKVYVYELDHDTGLWNLARTFSNPGGPADDFGFSLAAVYNNFDYRLNGGNPQYNNVLVGAPKADVLVGSTMLVDAGKAYLFNVQSGALLQTIIKKSEPCFFPTPYSPEAGDQFGYAVAAAGPNLLVGAPFEGSPDAGAAYRFQGHCPTPVGGICNTLCETTGAMMGRIGKPAGYGATGAFGFAVSGVGPFSAVGDPFDDTGATDAGIAFLFEGATHRKTFLNPSPSAGAGFGTSLATSAGDLLIGAPGAIVGGTAGGAAYLMNAHVGLLPLPPEPPPPPDLGSLIQTFSKTTPVAEDDFGTALTALEGIKLAITAPNDDGAGMDAGAVYVYDASAGTLEATIANPSPDSDEDFGRSIAATGFDLVVGDAHDGTGSPDGGAAFLFAKDVPAETVIGEWEEVEPFPGIATHLALQRDGKVLFWRGQGGATTTTWLWNPDPLAESTEVIQPSPMPDMFCSGHATLGDGRAIVIGGNTSGSGGGFHGEEDTNYFEPANDSWASPAGPPMAFRRWYPTATTLADGRVLATSGIQDGYFPVDVHEVLDVTANTWTSLGASGRRMLPLYPYMFLLPNGKLFQAGAEGNCPSVYGVPVCDPFMTALLNMGDPCTTTGCKWQNVGQAPMYSGSAAMYLPGKIVRSGGEGMDNHVTNKTAIIDMTVTAPPPAWQEVAPMSYPRSNHTLVLLPDGKVLVAGGAVDANDPPNAVPAAELWDPSTITWSALAAMSEARMYHSTALLLADGRVVAAGGDYHASYQVYTPPYLLGGARPAVTSAPTEMIWGLAQPYTIVTPDAGSIQKVALIRPGSVTHAFDQNQRYVPLNFTIGLGSISVYAPSDANTAPPGFYMLFLVNNSGVPSIARFVRMRGCG